MNHWTKHCAHQWASTQHGQTQIQSRVSFWPGLSWILSLHSLLVLAFLPIPLLICSSSFPSLSFPPPSVFSPQPSPSQSSFYQLQSSWFIPPAHFPLVFIPRPPCLHALFHFSCFVPCHVSFFLIVCFSIFIFRPPPHPPYPFFSLYPCCRASTPMTQLIFKNETYMALPTQKL